MALVIKKTTVRTLALAIVVILDAAALVLALGVRRVAVAAAVRAVTLRALRPVLAQVAALGRDAAALPLGQLAAAAAVVRWGGWYSRDRRLRRPISDFRFK